MARLSISVRGVSKKFPASPGSKEVLALDNVSLEIAAGEFVSVVGPSGCGKSTLLDILAGLTHPSMGEVYIGGKPVRGPHPEVGVVFQEDSTFPWLRVWENIEFALKARAFPAEQRRERIRQMIELVGLVGFENHYPQQLSGGMRQRVAIARTLALAPGVLLMDEPFGALDAQTRLLMGDELLKLWRSIGCTVVFVTHDIGEAVRLSNRVVVMTARPGRIKEVVNVDLPDERDFETVGVMEKYNQINAHIWHLLKGEVLRTVAVA